MDLKTVRLLKGITQLDLMRLSGIHNTRLSMLEKGHFRVTFKERKKIERALKTNLINWGGE